MPILQFLANFPYFQFITQTLVKYRIFVDFTYYRDYFRKLDLISRRDTRSLLWLNAVQFFLLFRIAFWLFFYVYQNYLSEEMNILHFNFVYMHGFSKQCNILAAAVLLMSYRFSELMYRQNTGITAFYTRRFLLERNFDLFVTPWWKVGQRMENSIESFSVRLRNVFQVIYISSILHTVVFTFEYFPYFYKIGYFGTVFGTFKFAYFLFNAFIFWLTCHLMIDLMVLTSVFAIMVSTGFWIILKQMERLLISYQIHQLTFPVLTRYFAHVNQLLICLADVNRVYGRAMLAFMIVNGPSNALIIITIFMQPNLGLVLRGFCIILAANQLTFLFLIHLAAVVMSQKFHDKPPKYVIAVGSISGKMYAFKWGLRQQLKMAQFVEDFCTKNHFGLTYGSVGKVTFVSFGRFIYFYVRGLIFAYKLMN